MSPRTKTPKVSIVIPWHFMDNWPVFLTRCLSSIEMQSFTDYEIILTKAGTMPVNTNRAMKCAKGEIVKILYMDDFFAHKDSLKDIVENFTPQTDWMVSGCWHTTDGMSLENEHKPSYNEEIHTGKNTIGSPSVLAMRRSSLMLFDENLSWLLDCDIYKRLHDKYGEPTILEDYNVVIGIHGGQTSYKMSLEDKKTEEKYVIKKYAK